MLASAVTPVQLHVQFTDRGRKLYIDKRFQKSFTKHELVVNGEKVTLYLCEPLSDRMALAVLCRVGSQPQAFRLNAAGISCSRRSKRHVVGWMLKSLRVSV